MSGLAISSIVSPTDQRVCRELASEIEEHFSRIGLLCRVFSRVKSIDSAERKAKSKGYDDSTKKMQDPIGIRIAVYFSEDVNICVRLIKEIYQDRVIELVQDGTSEDTFRPHRLNIVVRLTETQSRQLSILRQFDWIDNTFEIQVRTVLSEGWHEVEHDLRYKRTPDWSGSEDLSRAVNGIGATLETCDWSFIQLFDELALRHYRSRNWDGMLRSKFRLRFAPQELDEQLSAALNKDPGLAKSIYRSQREQLLHKIYQLPASYPITTSNLAWLCIAFMGHQEALKLVPKEMAEEVQDFIRSNIREEESR